MLGPFIVHKNFTFKTELLDAELQERKKAS